MWLSSKCNHDAPENENYMFLIASYAVLTIDVAGQYQIMNDNARLDDYDISKFASDNSV